MNAQLQSNSTLLDKALCATQHGHDLFISGIDQADLIFGIPQNAVVRSPSSD